MTRAKKPKHYLNNANLLEQILESKAIYAKNPEKQPASCLTPMLVEMFKLLVYRYSQKPNWRSYTWIDDMRSDALLILCQNAFKFDENKSNNPFGYMTQLTKNVFLSYIDKERKQRVIKDSILVQHGFLPSFAGQFQGGNDSAETYNEGSWEDYNE